MYLKETNKNLKNTDWGMLRYELNHKFSITGLDVQHGIDGMVNSLHRAINESYQKVFPEITKNSTKHIC